MNLDMTEFLERPPFPSFVQFETNTVCNAACTFCPYPQMTKRPRMPWSMILYIIEQVAASSSTICPFLYQEPLLEKRLVAILDNIKQFNPKCETVIFSNMSVMTPELAREIIESQLLDRLVVSYYAPNKYVYELLQPPLNFEQTAQNIRDFMTLRRSLKRSKPSVTLHYITIPPLVEHAEQFFKEWTPVVDKVGFVHYDTFHGVKPVIDETPYYGAPLAEVMVPCQRVWSQLNVLSNGDVVPCCLDFNGEVVLGNVEEKTLREIWLDEPYQTLRQSHVNGDIPELCRECTVYKYQFTEVWIKYWKQQNRFTGKPYPMMSQT